VADRACAVGRAYNVANPQPVTQVEFVDALARVAGKTAKKVLVPRKKLLALGGNLLEPPFYFAQYFDMPSITQNTDRARQDLGFEARPFDDGLAETFAWYQARNERPAPDFSFDDKVLAAKR
jgi:nucleoside-diphosphate-sugar epimerase